MSLGVGAIGGGGPALPSRDRSTPGPPSAGKPLARTRAPHQGLAMAGVARDPIAAVDVPAPPSGRSGERGGRGAAPATGRRPAARRGAAGRHGRAEDCPFIGVWYTPHL